MAQLCPCGLIGDNCTTLDPALSSFNDALSDFCDPEGFAECFVDSQYGSKCVCVCGYEGFLCETRKEPLLYIQILGFLVSILFIVGGIFAIVKMNTPFDSVFPKKASSASDGGILPSKIFLVYRLCIMLIGIIILISSLVRFGLDQLRFFTYWVWISFTIYFCLASYVSVKHNFPELFKQTEIKVDFGNTEKILFVLFEVVFVLALMITILTWLLILPEEESKGREEDLLTPRSYFFHGGNVALLLIDFIFTDVLFVHKHVLYGLVVMNTYFRLLISFLCTTWNNAAFFRIQETTMS
eukprot:maker-scaffold_50-snap-gene-1.8-mRNA-1 protein AED:0.09 eAED:0.09 QI:109/0.5/0.33/1/1/1/3/0/296